MNAIHKELDDLWAKMPPAYRMAHEERVRQIAAGSDRKIPSRCDAWYCDRRPTIVSETGDFLCDEHASLDQTPNQS
jgi:hypothetical protein